MLLTTLNELIFDLLKQYYYDFFLEIFNKIIYLIETIASQLYLHIPGNKD